MDLFMFSKNDTSKPSNTQPLTEHGYIVFSYYVTLSKQYVLFISCDERRTRTKIKLFQANNLANCVKEQEFEGRYCFAGLVSPGFFLLSREDEHEILTFRIENLEVQSSFKWSNYNYINPINEEYFFTINNINPRTIRGPFELKFYRWERHQPILMQQIPLNHGPHNSGSMSSVVSLGNGRFASHICGHNSKEFKVLIFECALNPLNQKFEIQINHIITPEAQHFGSGSTASGTILALPNGHLLTYHEHHDGLQIWDTGNGECLKTWNWSDIRPKQNFASFIKITPFPDHKHLLIHKQDSLFIFNMEQLTLKQIKISHLNCFGAHHVLPNGKLLTFHRHKGENELLKISLLDIPQTLAYQLSLEAFVDTQVSMYFHLFKNLSLPKELCLHILGYAFTPESQQQFVSNYLDNMEDNQNSSTECLVM